MAALNHISNKPYRNRLSLFLQLSAPRKSSQPGISSDSYFATTPTTSEMAEPLSPTSTRIGRNPSKVSSPIGAPRSPMQSDLEDSIPPTVNELDVREKARLLKKHRKLSRVFGQVPDLQLPSSSTRSWGGTSTPSHRRSASTHTNDSGASRRRATRKISSHSDLGSVSDNGTQLDEGNSIPPVPSLASNLPKDILEALTELNPSQHRKESSLNILTPPKPLSDDDHALSSPSSPVFNGLPDDVRRNRVAKLRRFLGDHGAPSRTLKTRKSYDSSMVKRLDEAAQDKHLHRSRSLTPYKKELDSNDSAVDFHRQYVQTYERGEYIQDAKVYS
ncbi:hypothetical protein GYMLUDRAFT_319393 [Collybiopsis luxurians FD-317 M1]|nr:hypothetical protein GYMLUDRAFT_319393 [Collybiopsis luxurians FD-317 M1]